MLNIMFDCIIIIILFLSFFALSNNMSANILNQRKEFGILRLIGMSKKRMMFLYFYEALVLVLASSLQGVGIGVIVGYAFTLQLGLFEEAEFPFFFPTEQFFIVMAFSIGLAGLSTVAPTSFLLKKEIATILRIY